MPACRPSITSTIFLLISLPALAQTWDLRSDTWVATDALNRRVHTSSLTGPPRADRTVGIFYHLWHGVYGPHGPFNINQIVTANPNAIHEPNHPAWGPKNAFHHWEEPLFGYYVSDDEWVLRRHASMLADAGVSVVIFDYSNGYMPRPLHENLCDAWMKERALGNATPQIVFLCPFSDDGGATVATQLYERFYASGRGRDLWFRWEGKPLIMAGPSKVAGPAKEFFTFRKPIPSYFTGPGASNEWGWLEDHPQHAFKNAAGESEQVCVGVGQNCAGGKLGPFTVPNSQGRSWCNEHRITTPDAVRYGYNFGEQWRRAFTLDPKFIFVTGWNEWTAMRFVENGQCDFWDQFTQEYSRDVEPVKGLHGDDYYYQMVSFIRDYKGSRRADPPSAAKTITIDGSFADWTDVTPEYRDTIGDTFPRNHAGYGQVKPYVNATGRNDIVAAKVARDAETLYFYVKTREPLTPHTGANWMWLLIDTDHRASTGWQGYDSIVNAELTAATASTLKRNTGGWHWQTEVNIRLRYAGNEMELAVPRSSIGQTGSNVSFDFHWADNVQKPGDIMDFLISGDSAPNGRFNYRYSTDTTPPPPLTTLKATRTGDHALRVSWTAPVATDYAGTIVRYRTDRFPDSPSDGLWICDKLGARASADSATYKGGDIPPNQPLYLAAFACDGAGNASAATTLRLEPIPVATRDNVSSRPAAPNTRQ